MRVGAYWALVGLYSEQADVDGKLQIKHHTGQNVGNFFSEPTLRPVFLPLCLRDYFIITSPTFTLAPTKGLDM